MTRLAAAAIGVLLGASLMAQNAQEGRFRTSVDTVSIYATVNDADGRLVPDLTKEDFTVLDNGAPRDITFFSSDIQPITVVVMLDMSESMFPDSCACGRRRCRLSTRSCRTTGHRSARSATRSPSARI